MDINDHIFCQSSSCIRCSVKCHRKPIAPTPVDEALELLFSQVAISPEKEFLRLADALERITAQDIFAALPVPVADCSMSDGIAVNRATCINRLDSGRVELPPEMYLVCSMGAAIPDCYDTVIPYEQVRMEANGTAVILALPQSGMGVIRAGEYIREGARAILKDHKLTGANVSLLRMVGVEEVPVWKKPHVRILPVGDDLVCAGQRPLPGQVVESNSILFESIARQCGGTAETLPIAADSAEAISTTMLDYISGCDVLVVCGGSGAQQGEYSDHTLQAVSKVGRILAKELACGPGGKATFLGEIAGKCVIGLPGPPHAALTVSEMLLPRVLEKFVNHPCYVRETVRAKLPPGASGKGRKYSRPHVKVSRAGDIYELEYVRMGETVDCFGNANAILAAAVDGEGEDGFITVQLLTDRITLERDQQKEAINEQN